MIRRKFEVHPHMRGENVLNNPVLIGELWYTPTCVGKTYHLNAGDIEVPVHPHMRGENFHHHRECAGSGRYTPTCVGKT